MSSIFLTIDGKRVEAQKGDTVLEAARKGGIEIPALCAHPALEPYGACRLCIVQIEGIRGLPTSCTTPAADGMVVKTATPEVVALRRNILKLLLSGHTSPCLVCPHRELCEKYRPNPAKAGQTTRCAACSGRATCEVRKLTRDLSVEDLPLPIVYRQLPVERDDPFIDRDYNLCLLCGRCVRICRKLHGKAAIEFTDRGKDARVGTAFQRDHLEGECVFCGACVDICPNGTLSDRFARWRGEPDAETPSACTLCPLGCRLTLLSRTGCLLSSHATALTREARICAVGRFVLPQLLDNPARLTAHQVRIPDGLRHASYEEAVAEAARLLAPHTGKAFALVAHPSATREELHLMRRFTAEVMKSDRFGVAVADSDGACTAPAAILKGIEDGSIRAVFLTGNFLQPETLGRLACRVVADLFTSPAVQAADVFLAAAGVGESDGTFLAASGEVRQLRAAARPPGEARPDWQIVRDLARAMKAPGFNFETAAAVTADLAKGRAAETPPTPPAPSPLDDLAGLPRTYRGHRLDEIVCALGPILRGKGQPTPRAAAPAAPVGAVQPRPFQILQKAELVPNTQMLTVYAPAIAAKCQPGQFVIAMTDERSERIPYTPADWDAQAGTVTFNVLETGRSSREMTLLRQGDCLAHFVGPLGKPLEIRRFGTVVCAGGCYGIGAMLPIARALKAAGNRVIGIVEASSHYLLYWRDRLGAHCDELLTATKDGSAGIRGGVQEALDLLAGRGEKIDQAFVCGCTFMMMLVSEKTKQLGIPTLTAMNPLMLDGTGMCGACRVSVGGETRFACVDGPFLDGHQIDWIQLLQRQAAFASEEVQALPQEHHKHGCGLCQ